MAAVAAPFDRDLAADFARIEKLVAQARAEGVRLLALPEAALGGYLSSLDGGAEGPPRLRAWPHWPATWS
jgi:N-carbamoylputrescine amidase